MSSCAGGPSSAVVTGDFNGDGNLDLAVANSGVDSVAALFGNGDGTFPNATYYATGGEDPDGLFAADLNGDGRPDLIATNSQDNTISVLLQSPAVTLSTSSLAFGSQAVGTGSNSQTTVLSNPGSAVLTIGSIAVTGANSSEYGQTSNCGSTLAAGSSRTIRVTFTPSVRECDQRCPSAPE